MRLAVLPVPTFDVTGLAVNLSQLGSPETFTVVSESALAATGHSRYTPAVTFVGIFAMT